MPSKHPATPKLCRWLPGCPLPQLVEDPLLLLRHRGYPPWGCRLYGRSPTA
ncbi:UNVERIFIED_CONTAM: hypothetical protein Slati_1912200 [Sesamum latifolium]|uniref:Uncharacterized protein n=1 Tax=Sesamum latifolium TaxID=2727402 RepID=A0AAW2X218_9LAMI